MVNNANNKFIYLYKVQTNYLTKTNKDYLHKEQTNYLNMTNKDYLYKQK